MDKFKIIENYLDNYIYLNQIEISGHIKLAQNSYQSNILIIYFDNEYLSYFKKISNLYNGKITKCNNYKEIIYSIHLYDIYILEYLSTFYLSINKKRNNQLYNSYIYLYNNQFKYFNTKCNNIEFMI